MSVYYIDSHIFYRMSVFDLEGMDTTWNSSQWVDVNETDKTGSGESDSSDNMPQLDGPADHKNGM